MGFQFTAFYPTPESPSKIGLGWGPYSTMDSILASHPAALGSNPGIPKKISDKKLSMLPRLVDNVAA